MTKPVEALGSLGLNLWGFSDSGSPHSGFYPLLLWLDLCPIVVGADAHQSRRISEPGVISLCLLQSLQDWVHGSLKSSLAATESKEQRKAEMPPPGSGPG